MTLSFFVPILPCLLHNRELGAAEKLRDRPMGARLDTLASHTVTGFYSV